MELHFWRPGSREYVVKVEVVDRDGRKMVVRTISPYTPLTVYIEVVDAQSSLVGNDVPPEVNVSEVYEELQDRNTEYRAYFRQFGDDGTIDLLPL